MWRMIPLLKMVARMVVAGIALSALHGLALRVTLGASGGASPRYFVASAVESGVFAGLILALPMALVTLVCFREIKRPLFYRFSMVTVSLILVMNYWQSLASYYHEALLSPGRDSWRLLLFALALGFYSLLVYASSLAARAYTREFFEQKLARQERELRSDRIQT